MAGADSDLEIKDAPLAQSESEFEPDSDPETLSQTDEKSTPITPDLYPEEESVVEGGATTPLASSSSGATFLAESFILENNEGDEWQDFCSGGSVVDGSGGVVVRGGCAESVFGSSSSGYSSLAGTCDNLSVHSRSVTSSVSGKSKMEGVSGVGENGFSESGSHGGSLEDLVESFDEKITACFGDLTSDISELAPVQITSHEEIISQSRFWNDLTSSFGTVMPVDWTKTVIRNKLFLPVLNLHSKVEKGMDESVSDDELTAQLDMHSIIAADHDDHVPYSRNPNVNKLATADEVIKEIDAIMQQGDGDSTLTESSGSERVQNEGNGQLALGLDNGPTPINEADQGDGSLPTLPSPLFDDKLQELSMVDLLELQAELERLTQRYSEILVQELALRDELQFEKEVKNSFISELIKVQNKRRQFAADKKKKVGNKERERERHGLVTAKYLTTVIPYESQALSTRHMQIMIKILNAINEDSPTTPTLLTDYILKVLCPKE